MNTPLSSETSMGLALDILADIIVHYMNRQAPPQVRAAILERIEREAEEQLMWELTAELLGTTDFRMVS